MLYNRNKRDDISIDLSPLIDVVFLLLIFFMVSTTFKDDHGLDLSLPGSDSKTSSKEELLTLTVDKEGVIRIGSEKVANESLENTIREKLKNYEQKMVVLKVDGSISHAQVMAAMDSAKKAGAEGLTFATSAKKTEDP